MIIFLDNKTLWPTIYRLSHRAASTQVAIAYLGKGASSRLNLKEGDRLIVSMSLQSLRTGQVDPYEVEKFMNKGVRVFTKDRLHAKVYVFDDKVVTCSANLSVSSEKNLTEAGLLTDDKKAVNTAKRFIRSNSGHEIDEPHLIWAKNNYVPSKGNGGQHENIVSIDETRYWLMSTEISSLPDDALNELYEADVRYKSILPDRKKFSIEYIEISRKGPIARSAKEGDRLIEIYYNNGSLRVHAPKMVLSNTLLYSYNKPIVRIAEPQTENSYTWQSFKSHLTKNGIRSIGKMTERELRGNTLATIESFFNQ